MTANTFRDAAIMLAAGMGIPVLAALNAQLGRAIASPAAAATVLFLIALIAAALAMLATTGAAPLQLVQAQPKHLLLGGVLVCFYVLSITFIAPRFGLGNAIFCVLVGQLVSAAVIDQFGLAGAIVKPVSLWRASGIGLMALGAMLAVQR
ncbi:MAG: DMT family transporter [Aestuariivirga sp.]